MSDFRFQAFTVSHDRASMRVGTDAVLLGACALNPNLADLLEKPLSAELSECKPPQRVLDIGCGCGLIALMIAQRFEDATIDAIDIDAPSIEDAQMNFERCEWASRLKAHQFKLQEWPNPIEPYDLLISNPPFYLDSPMARTPARHRARDRRSLPFEALCEHSVRLMASDGVLAVILPSKEAQVLVDISLSYGLYLRRNLHIDLGRPGQERRILEFERHQRACSDQTVKLKDLKLNNTYLLPA